MIKILLETWYIAAAGVAAAAAALLFWQKKRTETRKKKEQYEQRLKDQALNEALKNKFGRRNVFRQLNQARPLEKDQQQKPVKAAAGMTLVKLFVMGKETESYVVSPQEHVLLGSAAGRNDIILNGENIAQQHGDIFLYKEQVYVKNLEPACPMALWRKGGQTRIGAEGVRLLTGDQILMGSYRIQVTLMDYMGNSIAG